ncbi:MAG: glycosyltransferase family 4 protein [Deltaproteobacteria bacterium]|nr:glycosyltransferase family 4 protein [Deltaproteobacteria bacterium]
MGRILLVSKPLAPPWNDSGKNLVRDVARAMTRHARIVLTTRGGRTDWERVDGVSAEPVYLDSGAFSPPVRQNLRVLTRLLVGRRADVAHFFFAPNVRTSSVARVVCATRRMRSVQTVASAPRSFEPATRLFFGDVVVVLSRATERAAIGAGLAQGRLRRIPACVEPLPVAHADERTRARADLGLPGDARIVLFPGDLEMGGGARRMVRVLASLPSDVRLVLACRPKTAGARDAQAALERECREAGLHARLHVFGDTPRIHDLLRAADVVALPSTDLFAKMDQPLVLLEAMSLGRPVVVARETPADELADDGSAVAIGSDAELGSALLRLLDPEEGRRIGALAAASVRARYSPAVVAAAYERIYDELSQR